MSKNNRQNRKRKAADRQRKAKHKPKFLNSTEVDQIELVADAIKHEVLQGASVTQAKGIVRHLLSGGG